MSTLRNWVTHPGGEAGIHGGWHKCVEVSVNVENGILDEQMDFTFDDYYISEDFNSWD